MSREIVLDAAALSEPVRIELRESEAPKTCKAIRDALPIREKLVHGKLSGDEAFVSKTGEELFEIEPENWEYNPLPGEVGYFYSYWGDESLVRGVAEFSEIVFVYDRNIRIRKGPDRRAAVNLFGDISQNLDGFVDLCHQARFETNPTITLTEADS